jgi:hypothetical protein
LKIWGPLERRFTDEQLFAFLDEDEPMPTQVPLPAAFAPFLLALLVLLALPARAQSPEYKCTPPDVWSIRDAGPGKAIVTYSNSVNRCSAEVRERLRSPNGIEVDIHIQITGMDNDYRERITLNPVEAYMMSFPPEGDLIDGETQEFIIMGGLA